VFELVAAFRTVSGQYIGATNRRLGHCVRFVVVIDHAREGLADPVGTGKHFVTAVERRKRTAHTFQLSRDGSGIDAGTERE